MMNTQLEGSSDQPENLDRHDNFGRADTLLLSLTCFFDLVQSVADNMSLGQSFDLTTFQGFRQEIRPNTFPDVRVVVLEDRKGEIYRENSLAKECPLAAVSRVVSVLTHLGVDSSGNFLWRRQGAGNNTTAETGDDLGGLHLCFALRDG